MGLLAQANAEISSLGLSCHLGVKYVLVVLLHQKILNVMIDGQHAKHRRQCSESKPVEFRERAPVLVVSFQNETGQPRQALASGDC